MAGLIRNSKSKLEIPLWPTADTSVPVYSSMSQGYSAYYYFPAFSGGTAGRAIRIHFSPNPNTSSIYLYNADGTAVSDGVWNGGMTPDEASGSAATEGFVQYYMDDADNLLYLWTVDTGTSPYTFYLSSVNEAGSVTAIGNAQIGNASMNSFSPRGGQCGAMHRVGGDGSGNLQIPHFMTAGGNAAAAVPFRGAMVTINITNGSLSYANLLPSTFSQQYYATYGYGTIGTTANNILIQMYGRFNNNAPSEGYYANIYNLTTGKAGFHLVIPAGDGVLPSGTGFNIITRWRGKYHFCSFAVPYGKAMGAYSEADMHHWADQMAVFYGLL